MPGLALRGNIPDAFRVDPGASLLLDRSRVTLGGGWVASTAGSASIQVRDSTVVLVRCGHEGGICRFTDSQVQLLSVAGGQVELRRSALTGALVPQIGSGASIETAGEVLFEDSVVADTFDGLSFQVLVPARVDLRRFSYLRNGSPLLARVPLTVSIEDAEFVDNRNRWSGADGGPAAIHAYLGASFDLERTSFVGNLGSGVAGGAILVEGNASLRLANSTLANNSFTTEAAAGGARGGAVAVRAGNVLTRVEIVHATVVAPTIVPIGVTGSAFSVTGADAQVDLAVHNSIVRGSCSLGLVPGQMDAAQGNVKSSGDDCGFSAGQNQTGVSNGAMALGTLGDHGAFGRTYLPGPGSVAIDAAASSRCTPLDQRGFQRLLPGSCATSAPSRWRPATACSPTASRADQGSWWPGSRGTREGQTLPVGLATVACPGPAAPPPACPEARLRGAGPGFAQALAGGRLGPGGSVRWRHCGGTRAVSGMAVGPWPMPASAAARFGM